MVQQDNTEKEINHFDEYPKNILIIGEVKFESPLESMDSLIEKAIQIFSDKNIQSYLETRRNDRKLNGGGYIS